MNGRLTAIFLVVALLICGLAVGVAFAGDDPHATTQKTKSHDDHGKKAAGHHDDHGTTVKHDDHAAGHDDHAAGHDDHAVAHDDHGEDHGEFTVMGYLAHHLVDAPVYDLPWGSYHLPKIPVNIPQLGITDGIQLTKHLIGLMTSAILVILLVIPGMARTRRGEVPKGLGNFFEVLVIFVRDEVVYANMGKESGRKWLPFFLTAFFLILFSNLLGMIPFGTTATGNINVTAGLAILVLGSVFFAGFANHGIKYIATFIPHGVPVPIIPILFPIEIFGLFVKHFALCIRLFANMLAGHTVIGVFLALIAAPWIASFSVLGAVAISMLELFVAFLQSYVFVMLGSLFVGSAIHPSH